MSIACHYFVHVPLYMKPKKIRLLLIYFSMLMSLNLIEVDLDEYAEINFFDEITETFLNL